MPNVEPPPLEALIAHFIAYRPDVLDGPCVDELARRYDAMCVPFDSDHAFGRREDTLGTRGARRLMLAAINFWLQGPLPTTYPMVAFILANVTFFMAQVPGEW